MKLSFVVALGLALGSLSATEGSAQDKTPAQQPPASPSEGSKSPALRVYHNPKTGRIKNYKEALALNVEPTCSDFLGFSSTFVCSERSVLNSRKNDPQFSYLSSIQSKTDPSLSYFMAVIKPNSPAELRKALTSLQTQRTLDTSKINPVLLAEDEDDYITAVFQELMLPDDGRVDLMFANLKMLDQNKVEGLLQLIQWLHSQGLAAIDLDIGTSKQDKRMKLSYLLCLTNLGDPIGSCIMKPELVDPRARWQSEKVKADEAMDYYAFACHVARWVISPTSNLQQWSKTLREMKDTGKVIFPRTVSLELAMILVAFLQKDPSVRLNPELRKIFLDIYVQKKTSLPFDGDFVWLVKDSVYEVPEFQEKLQDLGISKKQTIHDEAPLKNEVAQGEWDEGAESRTRPEWEATDTATVPLADAKAEEESKVLGMTRLALISIISFICLFVIALLIYLFFRKNPSASEAGQPLEAVAANP